MRINRTLALLLLAALSLPACSHYSADARRQRAYAKYVRKSSAARQEQRAKVQRAQQEIPSEPTRTEVTTEAESAPADG